MHACDRNATVRELEDQNGGPIEQEAAGSQAGSAPGTTDTIAPVTPSSGTTDPLPTQLKRNDL